MATIIQIKRSTSGNPPTTGDLVEAELAYSQDKSNDGSGAILYIESVNNDDSPAIHKVGGKYYTDIVDTANNLNSASSLVQRDASGDFSANAITADLFIGDFTGTIVGGINLGSGTNGDYVANVLAGTGINVTDQGGETANVTVALADTAVSPGTYGGSSKVASIVIDQQGRITSAVNVDVSTSITLGADFGAADQLDNNDTLRVLGGNAITTFVTDNTITVSADTSGVVAATYGDSSNLVSFEVDEFGRITSAANVFIDTSYISNGTVSTASAFGDTTNFLGTAGEVFSELVGNTFTIGLIETGVSATTYGGAANIPVFTVDSKGRITSASNTSISTDLEISDGTSSDTVSLATETLDFIGGTGIQTAVSSNTVTITNLGVITVAGTANEIEVDGGTAAANGTITIGLPNNVTIQEDLSVSGNLYVSGTAFTVGAETITINDPLIHLANNNTSSDVVDIGFEGHYFDGATQRHAGLFRDASDGGLFKFFANVAIELESATTVNTNAEGYETASLVANLTGGNIYSLAAAIGVADGGTGKQSVTTNAILYGQGTSALAEATGTAGQVLQLNGSGVPVFGVIDGGTY